MPGVIDLIRIDLARLDQVLDFGDGHGARRSPSPD